MKRFLTSMAVAISLPCAVAHATTIYDTIGVGNAYENQQGWTIGNPSNGAHYSAFAQFSPLQSGYLASAIAPIWHGGGALAPLRFEVRADEGGHPGAVLALATVSFGANGGLVSGAFSGDVWISAQRAYWFGLAATDPTTLVGWYQNPGQVKGLNASTGALWQQPNEWFVQTWTLGAFQLDARVAAAVPEPASALMLSMGLSLVVLGAARRKRAALS